MKTVTTELDLAVGAGSLRIREIGSLCDVSLGDYEGEHQRLIMFAPAGELLDDGGMASYCFEIAIGRRGILTCVDGDLPSQVAGLASQSDSASNWLAAGHEVTICLGGAFVVLAAAIPLLARGFTPVEAIDAVEKVMPDAFDDIDLEIAVSVGRDHLIALRDLQRRRAEAVQRGESYWSVQ